MRCTQPAHSPSRSASGIARTSMLAMPKGPLQCHSAMSTSLPPMMRSSSASRMGASSFTP
ncbi:hypothetical protein PG995_008050 [Apiospora arundinis]|uniref:Uncharacterized protein n=1 Tax=Apiospora arundinis TaxID=335852 RepID=A0ABR2HZU9_9PEZI